MIKARVNFLTALPDFITAWDKPSSPLNGALLPLLKGTLGHINLRGTPEAPGPIFGRFHPQFVNSLEEGVKEVVIRLIERFNCITYSSCEGHRDEAGQLIAWRTIGLLPRNDAEHNLLKKSLQEIFEVLNARGRKVLIRLDEETLNSNEQDLSCLDIVIVPVVGHEDIYFREADSMSEELISLLGSAS